MSRQLYDQIVAITDTYLGPASERFVNRQIKNHLHKPPLELTAADLPSLIRWIRVTASVLTEDTGMVKQYISELEKLCGRKRPI